MSVPRSVDGPRSLPRTTPQTPARGGVSFKQFCDGLHTFLPGDEHGRGSFDTRTKFMVGDPGASIGNASPLVYETTGEVGRPYWEELFAYILRHCGYLLHFHTVYVMVDTRDLANHKKHDASLPHWPAAARWWHSRLQLVGPKGEKTELLLLPISQSTGLQHVHPTWAGTFVLAALVAVFPGINFVLLDSDCLPVTLFEVEDLWTEAYLARYPAHTSGGIPKEHPLHKCQRFHDDPQVEYTQHRVCSTRMGQGVLVVTEPHSELNAGWWWCSNQLILLYLKSDSSAPRLRGYLDPLDDDEIKDEATKVTQAFWQRIGG